MLAPLRLQRDQNGRLALRDAGRRPRRSRGGAHFANPQLGQHRALPDESIFLRAIKDWPWMWLLLAMSTDENDVVGDRRYVITAVPEIDDGETGHVAADTLALVTTDLGRRPKGSEEGGPESVLLAPLGMSGAREFDVTLEDYPNTTKLELYREHARRTRQVDSAYTGIRMTGALALTVYQRMVTLATPLDPRLPVL